MDLLADVCKYVGEMSSMMSERQRDGVPSLLPISMNWMYLALGKATGSRRWLKDACEHYVLKT